MNEGATAAAAPNRLEMAMTTIDTMRLEDEMTRGVHVETPRAFPDMAREIAARIALWRQKRESRRVLRELTDDELRDIGLSRQDVAREVSKSRFWD
jgi:uncharacterized protein YjiS (DUF1127 family)